MATEDSITKKTTGGALELLKVALEAVSNRIGKKNKQPKDCVREYRERQHAKDDSFRNADNARKRKERTNWTTEQKERHREQARLRNKAFRERQKQKKLAGNDIIVSKMNTPKPRKTRQQKQVDNDMRAKRKLYMQRYRAQLSTQKQRRVREKQLQYYHHSKVLKHPRGDESCSL